MWRFFLLPNLLKFADGPANPDCLGGPLQTLGYEGGLRFFPSEPVAYLWYIRKVKLTCDISFTMELSVFELGGGFAENRWLWT